jgi:hypothetical protein
MRQHLQRVHPLGRPAGNTGDNLDEDIPQNLNYFFKLNLYDFLNIWVFLAFLDTFVALSPPFC